MKKRIIIILLIIVVLLVGGGIGVWKLSSNKEKTDSSNQQKTNPPLHELSDQELKKCLLEDFSRRLDLKKYFVFNLGELTKEKVFHGEILPNGEVVNKVEYGNSRKANSSLARDLTKLSNSYNQGGKNFVIFQDEKFSNPSDEWENKELDQKIDHGNLFVIFEKDDNIDYTYGAEAMGGNRFDWVFVRVKSPTTTICDRKEKALEILKTDPALTGKF